MKSVFEGI